MKLQGSVEIQVRDSRTGKLKQTIKQDNLITNTAHSGLLEWGVRGIFNFYGISGSGYETFIFISSSQATPNPALNPSGILAVAYTPAGVTKATFNDSSPSIFGQLQGRIDFTGTARTFYTVGLREGRDTTIHAYLLLDTPCTQGAFDILDIFYRIQFLNTAGQGLPKQALIDFGKASFNFSSFDMSRYWTSVCSTPSNSYPYELFNFAEDLGTSFDLFFNRVSSGPIVGTRVLSHFKFKMSFSYDLNSLIGLIFNSILQGRSGTGRGIYTCKKLENLSSPFQNLFSHSADATVPFFDSLKLASGNGKVLLNGTWTNKFPELYKLTIVADGATGIATYKWSVRRHLGFNGNTYSDRAVGCPFRNPTTPAATGMHGWRDENNDVLQYSSTQIVQYDDTGVTLLDVLDGRYQSWDASTLPALPVTQARQVAVDLANKRIYVGCRLTGLWLIDVTANTVTQIKNTPCYGVDVGRNAITFALFEGGLYRSSDWITPLAFTYAGITDGNWSRVQFLKADPEHIEDRLALVMTVPNTSNRRVVWWNAATGTSATGLEGTTIKPWSASLDVSDTGSFWASGVGRLTYGSTTTATLGTTLSTQSLTSLAFGTDNFYKISFYKNFLIGQSSIVTSAGAVQNTYTSLGSKAFILHMDGGIALTNREMRSLFTDNVYGYDNYGWNGTTWELNHAGARTTHSTNEILGNGITARFENGANAPHFIATDYYTQGVCNGVLKDNATTLYYESAWYSKPAQFNHPVQANVTVPAAAPYQITLSAASEIAFIRIETDSPELIKLTLNGQPVTTVYIGGTTPPGLNEIRVDASGNGIIEFNSADAGKTVGGIYSFIKN